MSQYLLGSYLLYGYTLIFWNPIRKKKNTIEKKILFRNQIIDVEFL